VLEVDEVTYTSTVTGTYSELNTGARQLKYYTNLQPFKGLSHEMYLAFDGMYVNASLRWL
jgi:hypothetical protein